jgi:hypothetical protein
MLSGRPANRRVTLTAASQRQALNGRPLNSAEICSRNDAKTALTMECNFALDGLQMLGAVHYEGRTSSTGYPAPSDTRRGRPETGSIGEQGK